MTPSSLPRLELLGPGRVVGPGGEVLLRSGLPLVLLAYLHAARVPLLRETLAQLFWPGRDRPLALQSLRQALSRLRSVLGEDAIVSEGRHLSLREGTLQSDLAALRTALESADPERIAPLWQGPFLAEARFPGNHELEEWLERERARHGETFRRTLLAHARTRIDEGRSREALPLVQLLRARLPADEGVLLLHFEALLTEGRRDEAAGVLEELRVLEGASFDPGPHEARWAAVGGAGEPLLPEEEEERGTDSSGEAERRPAPAAMEGSVPAPPAPTAPPDPPALSPPPPLFPPRAPNPSPPLRRPAPFRPRAALMVLGAAVLLLTGAVLALNGRSGPGRGSDAALALPARGEADLLFCTSSATGGVAPQLYRMDLQGLHKHRLSDLVGCNATWVPGANAIVFLAEPGGGGGDNGSAPPFRPLEPGAPRLHRLDPLPGNPQAEWRITPLESTRGLREIEWPYRQVEASAGERGALLIAREAGGTPSIYLVDPTADRLLRLTDDAGAEEHPAWDAHRGLLLFSSDRGGRRELWALNPDAPDTLPRRLLESPTADTRPVPHARGILFVRGVGEGPAEGDLGIHLLEDDPDRPGEFRHRILVGEPWNDLNPAWSPDGRHLCWQSEEFGHFESQVKVMEVASRTQWSVTANLPGRSANRSITPDGNHVLFGRLVEEGFEQVFRVPLAGGDAENISRTSAPAHPQRELPAGTLPHPAGGGREG